MFERFFKKTALDAVVQASRKDQARMAVLKGELAGSLGKKWQEWQASAQSAWRELQELDGTFTPGCSPMLEQRKVVFQKALDESLAARDAVTADTEKELASLWHRHQMRNTALVNGFSMWFACAGSPPRIAAEAKEIHDYEPTGETAELARMISAAVEKISDDPDFGRGAVIHLPNLDHIAAQAASAAA